MSFDIMVIDRHERFTKARDFDVWYKETTEWKEPIDYDDISHATPRLQAWYQEVIQWLPPLNGPLAKEENVDEAADYTIARDSIMVSMSYDQAGELRTRIYNLSMSLGLAFFDISASSGLFYPDGWSLKLTDEQMALEDAEEEKQKGLRKLENWGKVMFGVFIALGISLFISKGEVKVFHIILFLLGCILAGYVGWLSVCMNRRYEKRIQQIAEQEREKEKEKEMNNDHKTIIHTFSYPSISSLDEPLKTMVHQVPSTRLILYYYVKQKDINQDWKDWAYSMIEAGYHTEAIVQLAGEYLTMNPFEFKELANQIFAQLGVIVNPETAYEQYVLYTAQQVGNQEITAHQGFERLTQAAIESDYHETFSSFYYYNCDMEENVALGYASEDYLENTMKEKFRKILLRQNV